MVKLARGVMSKVRNETDMDFSAALGEVKRHLQIWGDRSRGKDREFLDLEVNIAERLTIGKDGVSLDLETNIAEILAVAARGPSNGISPIVAGLGRGKVILRKKDIVLP